MTSISDEEWLIKYSKCSHRPPPKKTDTHKLEQSLNETKVGNVLVHVSMIGGEKTKKKISSFILQILNGIKTDILVICTYSIIKVLSSQSSKQN